MPHAVNTSSMDVAPKMEEYEAPTLIVNPVMITKECRHGMMSWTSEDEFVGKALSLYGEYSEGEVEMIRQILQPGDVAIDVGANIGALTVVMAKIVGPDGMVYAFEPGENNIKILHKNLQRNCPSMNHVIMPVAAGKTTCETPVAQVASKNLWRKTDGKTNGGQPLKLLGPEVKVSTIPIDNLKLEKLKFVKIDVDGMEIDAIEGMDETIKRCRPFIYVENEQPEDCENLIASLTSRGYRLYWHRPTQYSKDNFRKETFNFFGNIVSIMMLAVPEELGVEIDGLEEVADIRDDDHMFEREITRYNRYVERKPDDWQARLMLAHNLNLMHRRNEANAHLSQILAANPDHVAARALRGLIDLQNGDWHDGWRGFDLRFKQKNLRSFGGHRHAMFNEKAPQWDGSPTDERVYIWSEQGFGDMIMFARLMRHVLQLAPNAVLECHDSLFELFQQSEISPRGLYRLNRSLPDFDLQCSLPTLATILDADADLLRMIRPYLKSDQALTEAWIERANPRGIGICHRGSPKSERPFTRDISPEALEPIAKYGPFFMLRQEGQFENFADTAAAIETLNLIITVDTSVAHLAGAMGKEVWLLLSYDPDWRWGLHGERTVWYPSMRIFRQKKFRDWQSVIERVNEALSQRVGVR